MIQIPPPRRSERPRSNKVRMKKLIVANWKSNPSTEEEAIRLAKQTDFSGIVVAPPFVFIEAVGKNIAKAKLGAQNVFWAAGAHTGETSPEQLKNLGVSHVIIGHSELRAVGETDEMVNKKVTASLDAGFKPILCVGESAASRGLGIGKAKDFVRGQLSRDLTGIGPKVKEVIVAYEPIWAIGTGNPDNPESAAEMAGFIKETVFKEHGARIMVLYGGSVNGGNAGMFLSKKDIDGALVGGASLKPEDFAKIVEAGR